MFGRHRSDVDTTCNEEAGINFIWRYMALVYDCFGHTFGMSLTCFDMSRRLSSVRSGRELGIRVGWSRREEHQESRDPATLIANGLSLWATK